ncbi:Rv3235 family protein [Streptomyces sp. 7R007]
MNKVMTRAQLPLHPGTRPPTRRDSRRPGTTPPRAPGGLPPRTPGGTSSRTSPGDGRPPGSPTGRGLRARTRPADNRPQTPQENRPGPAPGNRPRPTLATHQETTAPQGGVALSMEGSDSPLTHAPAQTPRRPAVPQPRPTDLFAELLLAVLSGQRPVHSMLRHTAGRAYDELAWLAERGPLRARGTRPVVRDIGYYVAGPGALEAFARIGAGDQLRAMAFRLERGQDLRWRCTAVELGGPRPPRTRDDH